MHIRKRVAVLVGGVAALGVAGFGLLAGPALAEPAPSPSASASASAEPGKASPGKASPGKALPDREKRQEELAAALAKELGVDQAKVSAALEKIRAERESEFKAERLEKLKTRLDEAVTDGKITAEQRDAILEAAESGVFPGGGPGGFGWFGGHGRGPR